MPESRQTTIRFSDPMYRRLEVAGQLTGLPINSIVVIACLEWLDEHQPMPAVGSLSQTQLFPYMGPPLGWRKGTYPFDRFTNARSESSSWRSQPLREVVGAISAMSTC